MSAETIGIGVLVILACAGIVLAVLMVRSEEAE